MGGGSSEDVGKDSESFIRTKYRKDYSVTPPEETIFDLLLKHDSDTVGIGKIDDLFGGKGIKHKLISKGNRECVKTTIEAMDRYQDGLIMTNLVDFDMLFGHQRNTNGYYDELVTFDVELGTILEKMTNDDLLIITSDHGNDPTFKGSDHTREYVPLIVYSKNMQNNVDLGTRKSFADVGKTLADYFQIDGSSLKGTSFYSELNL